MAEAGPEEAQSRPRPRRLAGVVGVVIALALVAGTVAIIRASSRTNTWWSSYGLSDVAALNQDNRALAAQLGRGDIGQLSQLHFVCQVGARDLARVLSHPAPPEASLRAPYRAALESDATLFRLCERVSAPSATGGTSSALRHVRPAVADFDRAVVAANAQADRAGHPGLLSPVR